MKIVSEIDHLLTLPFLKILFCSSHICIHNFSATHIQQNSLFNHRYFSKLAFSTVHFIANWYFYLSIFPQSSFLASIFSHCLYVRYVHMYLQHDFNATRECLAYRSLDLRLLSWSHCVCVIGIFSTGILGVSVYKTSWMIILHILQHFLFGALMFQMVC